MITSQNQKGTFLLYFANLFFSPTNPPCHTVRWPSNRFHGTARVPRLPNWARCQADQLRAGLELELDSYLRGNFVIS